jgi:hypothetical protein
LLDEYGMMADGLAGSKVNDWLVGMAFSKEER